ncbi:DUF3467 domain-containing protein [Octadecabacter sp. G9-8]|uniref:DUF3467 domain-containing protein n=1 Tax=Octadecabacter dasysiphoniae TaxID=2909341 RepID=A0ABS9CYN9_9RHOB|nr:DUF3467 domain-containing protein [Octadecabacter dasysiphoniae]MCF2872363.1 DUF3467 domain-containing protein [Octadecabacter dasysiphoniae]
MADDKDNIVAKAAEGATINGMSINWDDAKMESVYANIGTATANREEFFLLFGTHQNWRGTEAERKAVDVELSKRIVMSPFAAKRLAIILQHSIKAYEDQFGEVKL